MKKGDYVYVISIHKTDRAYGLCEEINKIYENHIAIKILEVYEDTNSAVVINERTNNPYTFIKDDLILIDEIESTKESQIFHYNPETLVV